MFSYTVAVLIKSSSNLLILKFKNFFISPTSYWLKLDSFYTNPLPQDTLIIVKYIIKFTFRSGIGNHLLQFLSFIDVETEAKTYLPPAAIAVSILTLFSLFSYFSFLISSTKIFEKGQIYTNKLNILNSELCPKNIIGSRLLQQNSCFC